MSPRRSWNDDPFTKKARKEDFLARSVYKLAEIDQKENLVRSCKTIVDLGASPGSWSQYCLKQNPTCKIFAIDLQPLEFQDARLNFLQESIETVKFENWIPEKVDLVLSDMAPKTSGIADRDSYLSYELSTLALETATKLLKPNGSFIVKLFMGSEFKDYEKCLKSHFSKIRFLRPESTRKNSREIFCICRGFISAK
jgi:23S rRNA (uridine2552-2'-O)-methyltransferase